MSRRSEQPRSPIAEIVRRVIAETCGCEVDAVRPDALFFDLLPLDDSLELMEVEFRLGKAFLTPIKLGNCLLVDFATDRKGALSPAYLASLRHRFPFLPFDRLPPSPRPTDLHRLLTIDAITRLVAMQLSKLPAP